jgi:hypothetical protein
LENPEQQIFGSVVTLPLCCDKELETQYNTGDDELKAPNLGPDYVTRVAWDPTEVFHVDAGGVVRQFRHILSPFEQAFHKTGGGASINLISSVKGTRLLLQTSWGSGMGRYIGGLVPDVVFRSDSTISPIRTWSWVGGVERKIKDWEFSGYYSGLYTHDNFVEDTDGSFIGFGFPGASLSNNRLIHEATATASIKIWKTEDRGSLQAAFQGSWLQRNAWAPEDGLHQAKAPLFFAQLRYNLP